MPRYNWKISDLIYEDEVLRMYKAAKNNNERVLISILWITGGRINECLAISKEDVMPFDEEVHIIMPTEKLRGDQRFAVEERILKFDRPKGIISSVFVETIIAATNNLLPNDKLINRGWRWANGVVTRLGIQELGKPICPYHFRHSRFTILANNGYDAWQLKAIKGSKRLASVEVYVHTVPELVKLGNMDQTRRNRIMAQSSYGMKLLGLYTPDENPVRERSTQSQSEVII